MSDPMSKTASTEFGAAMAQHAEEAMILFDSEWVCKYANQSTSTIYGYCPADMSWTGLTSGIHPDDRDRVLHRIQRLASGEDVVTTCEYRLLQSDGGCIFVESRFVRAFDQPRLRGMAVFTRDVTARVTLDPHTALPNRRMVLERLRLLGNSEDPGQRYAVLVIRVDRFSSIKASLNAGETSQLMAAVGRRIRNSVPPAMVVASLEPGVFGVVTDVLADAGEADKLGRGVTAALQAPVPMGERSFQVTASIGVALAGNERRNAEELLKSAHVAVQSARGAGRSQAIFDTQVMTTLDRRAAIEAALPNVVGRGELEVFYQPLIRLDRRELAGFEALVRWTHPTLGFVSPGVFIPIAEDVGQISAIGEFVLRQSCKQLKEWLDRHPTLSELKMSINLSPAQITEPGIGDRLVTIVRQCGVSPTSIKLELTESAFIRNPDQVQATLQGLADAGFSLALDDFGTGFSSLSYLSRFPFDTLKIDREFIFGLSTADPRTQNLVASIVNLGQTLDMRVIAEGVEEEAHVSILVGLGCEYAQGYFFGRPAPAPEAAMHVEGLLDKRVRATVHALSDTRRRAANGQS